MSSFSCKGNTKESLAQLKAKLLPYSTQETKPQYTLWRLKMDGCTATAYTSGTLLLQGTDIAWAMDLIDHDRIDYKDVVTFPRAGSDEAGCGEYYGPMTFGAVIVPTPAIAEQLTREGLRDTKKMTDKAVLRLDALVRQTCTFACVTVHPEQYNRLVKQGMSLVDMKCFFHDKVWKVLADKEALPGIRTIDAFCTKKHYYELRYMKEPIQNIEFKNRADSEDVSVMAAAVIARAKYLNSLDKLRDEYDFNFPKGAGQNTVEEGVKFIQEHDITALDKVAKVNFTNTNKIRARAKLLAR